MLPVFLFLLSSCASSWRGDGPPEILSGTAWTGTNQARGEVLDMFFGLSGNCFMEEYEDGSTFETGDMRMIFSYPAEEGSALRDSMLYTGTYTYSRTPTGVLHDVFHGNVSFYLVNVDTGDSVHNGMSYHNQRFYTVFGDTSYPTDPAEDSWINSVR